MVRKPDVFLFDEPLSNLDAKLRVSTRVSIAQLHNNLKQEGQNATMIYVTHDPGGSDDSWRSYLCIESRWDHASWFADESLSVPANKFVAGFIGSPAMNALSG